MSVTEIKEKWLKSQIDLLEQSGTSKAQIARDLDIAPQQLNNILNGSRGISDKFIDKFIERYNLNQIDLFNDSRESGKIIPLIPQEAFAGYGTIEYPDLPIEEYYQISEFNKADFLIRVNGDSMVPKYHGGDIVACMKIKEVTFWQWHRIYAISTKSQGILIKRVEKDDNPDTLRLVSENPAYLPFSVKKEEIQDVALVLGAITLE